MADLLLNHQVIDAIEKVRASVSAPGAVRDTGSGKAFNFVAQATAMAIQDATDNLRNVSTMSTTAIGVAMTQLISSGDTTTWTDVIRLAQNLVKSSADDFKNIGATAATVMRSFPPCEPPPAAQADGDQ
jgi:hypothetical protein